MTEQELKAIVSEEASRIASSKVAEIELRMERWKYFLLGAASLFVLGTALRMFGWADVFSLAHTLAFPLKDETIVEALKKPKPESVSSLKRRLGFLDVNDLEELLPKHRAIQNFSGRLAATEQTVERIRATFSHVHGPVEFHGRIESCVAPNQLGSPEFRLNLSSPKAADLELRIGGKVQVSHLDNSLLSTVTSTYRRTNWLGRHSPQRILGQINMATARNLGLTIEKGDRVCLVEEVLRAGYAEVEIAATEKSRGHAAELSRN